MAMAALQCCTGFNPRARTGANGNITRGGRTEVVSIHAPVRARTVLSAALTLSYGFQSTRPYGRERRSTRSVRNMFLFQSTRPYGRERSARDAPAHRCCFNPRARTGANRGVERLDLVADVFQSTRPYGREPANSFSPGAGFAFQSTRPYGRELNRVARDAVNNLFQSTRPYRREPPLARC